MTKNNMVLPVGEKQRGSGHIFAFFQTLGEKCSCLDFLLGSSVSIKAK